MATDIPLIWVAASDADASTQYRVESDKATSGTFATVATQASTDRGDGSYTPYSTTLNGAIVAADTTIILTSGTNFSANDYALINREIIKLGTKSTNTFSNSTRAIGGSIPQAHSNGATVYKAHESYTDSAVAFGSRYLIRYRIVRLQSSNAGVAVEILALNPPLPPSTDFCTVYGVIQTVNNTPLASASVTLAIADKDNYILGTGELLAQSTLTTSSDDDGFWYFYIPKDVARGGGDTLTLTVNGLNWPITAIPDQSALNFLRV